MELYKGIFAILPKNEEKKEFGIFVNRGLVSKKIFKSEEEAKAYIDEKPWEIIVSTTQAMIMLNEEFKNILNKEQTE